MTFIDELRDLKRNNRIPKWFTVADVKRVTNKPEANNLSNYAVDNTGSSNLNQKVLNRRLNSNGNYEYSV